jgi:hypothetical protein
MILTHATAMFQATSDLVMSDPPVAPMTEVIPTTARDASDHLQTKWGAVCHRRSTTPVVLRLILPFIGCLPVTM